ncbi:hypothetical protein VNO78_21366 [Psophocarpus tetragonolobus]|uniref:Uncharacterized protein n=1 Tax=Psophocarpus tetragonolobus TaxID=3891 RepID=A0AAN9XI46_PSOTE
MASRKHRGRKNLLIKKISKKPKDLLIKNIPKKPRTKTAHVARRNFLDFKDFANLGTCHQRSSCKSRNKYESPNSSESMEIYVIPRDISDLNSLMVSDNELYSHKFFEVSDSSTRTLCEERKEDDASFMSMCLADFVIPGNIPDLTSLMVSDNDLYSHKFFEEVLDSPTCEERKENEGFRWVIHDYKSS